MKIRTNPELNVRQQRFCEFVVQGIPPRTAYAQAGYSAKTHSNYNELMDSPKIIEHIKKLQGELKRDMDFITKEYLIQCLQTIKESSASDIVKLKAIAQLSKLLGFEEENVNIKTDNGPLFTIMPKCTP